MSTRAMIGIYTDSIRDIAGYEELVYVASDGYPEDPGIIRHLVPFMAYFKKNMGNDTYYIAANLIYLIKKEHWEKHIQEWGERKKAKLERTRQFIQSPLLKYALEGCSQVKWLSGGNLNYFYRINMKEGKILVYRCLKGFGDNYRNEECLELLYVIPFRAKVPEKGFTGKYLNENFSPRS